eukprot:4846043-Amphidinium_carterae.1
MEHRWEDHQVSVARSFGKSTSAEEAQSNNLPCSFMMKPGLAKTFFQLWESHGRYIALLHCINTQQHGSSLHKGSSSEADRTAQCTCAAHTGNPSANQGSVSVRANIFTIPFLGRACPLPCGHYKLIHAHRVVVVALVEDTTLG